MLLNQYYQYQIWPLTSLSPLARFFLASASWCAPRSRSRRSASFHWDWDTSLWNIKSHCHCHNTTHEVTTDRSNISFYTSQLLPVKGKARSSLKSPPRPMWCLFVFSTGALNVAALSSQPEPWDTIKQILVHQSPCNWKQLEAETLCLSDPMGTDLTLAFFVSSFSFSFSFFSFRL